MRAGPDRFPSLPGWLFALSLCACSTQPERPPVEDPHAEAPSPREALAPDEAPLRAMLSFYAGSTRASTPLPRERPVPTDPRLRMQQAIQLGQARPAELPRAVALLDGILRSHHPVAQQLAPLARILHEQYGERLRLEQQLRDAQRRGEQLQEKIDALTAIERALPVRPPRTASPKNAQENSR